MKVVLLAGGFGTRISEESHLIPKPMINIGGFPIIWHIMKYFSEFGLKEFIILAGYKQEVIKGFFNNYFLFNSDIVFDLSNGEKSIIQKKEIESWKVTVLDTGLETMTGGRLKRAERLLANEDFVLTYGDVLSNVDLKELLRYHYENKKVATITAIQPGGRFGTLNFSSNGSVIDFKEKFKEDGGWINGGFMVFDSSIFKYINDDTSVLEKDVLSALATKSELAAYKHTGFWQSMDTMRDKTLLEDLWKTNNSPWKIW